MPTPDAHRGSRDEGTMRTPGRDDERTASRRPSPEAGCPSWSTTGDERSPRSSPAPIGFSSRGIAVRSEPGPAGGRPSVLRVEGDMCTETLPPAVLRAMSIVVELADRDVDVDLGAVSFVDGRGVGALVLLRRAAERRGVALRVVGPSGRVRRLLEICDLDGLIAAPVSGAIRPPVEDRPGRPSRSEVRHELSGAVASRRGG
ncbi:STAS domain-containing protein [Ilumatobacter sp.]|uniref:STAS domain-containing protein n=1 Tax=Ilumatobacter sp. TaxID=1967498 RepID=UPI003B52F68A